MKSVICEYIKNHPTTWREDFEAMSITVKENGNLAIFNYSIMADFHNEIVCEARGIIIDLSSLRVVCWPFRKFGNWDCSYADPIDWESAKIQEKVDGSIVKMYYYNNQWNWATNGNIFASDAPLGNNAGRYKNFLELIQSAENYANIFTDIDLDTNCTYIFELTSPYNKVVIDYSSTMLTITGIRNNVTGEESTYYGAFKSPRRYYAKNFEQCRKLLSNMNKNKLGKVNDEGFVVVDKDYHRIKIKTEEYFAMHHAINNGLGLRKEELITFCLHNRTFLNNMAKQLPKFADVINHYKREVYKLVVAVNDAIHEGKRLFKEEFNCDKKQFALAIKNNPYKSVMFEAVKHLDEEIYEMWDAEDFLCSMSRDYIDKLIPDYIGDETVEIAEDVEV